MRHFSSLSEYLEYLNWPKPEYPMLGVVSLSDEVFFRGLVRRSSPPVTNDFYMVAIKRLISGSLLYGRTKYDFSNGTMKFLAPDQVLEWEEVEMDNWGYAILFHKDYVRGHELENRLKKYGFFSYATHEALHLSPREERVALTIFETIMTEYLASPDEFSREIILSQLDTLFRYSDRFYKRQFQDRRVLATEMSERLNAILRDYFESGRFEEHGVPSIEWIAGELNMSARYLSDALKSETGRTTMEHVHLFLIDEAKSLLLVPSMSVSETAYRLGFEYPQYFSRLFRKKVGMSPKEYQKQSIMQ